MEFLKHFIFVLFKDIQPIVYNLRIVLLEVLKEKTWPTDENKAPPVHITSFLFNTKCRLDSKEHFSWVMCALSFVQLMKYKCAIKIFLLY